MMSPLGLQLLRQAHEYAHELDRDDWDFAVELPALQKAGLSSNDIRWLLCKGHVEHAREIASESDSGRSFRRCKHWALRKRSCFVLTDSGVEFVQKFARQHDAESNESISLVDYPTRRLGGANAEDGNEKGNNSKGVPGGADIEITGTITGTSGDVLMTPTWDCVRQDLRLGTNVVKEFRMHSPNQVSILTAFEEEGWPLRVDDPLPPQVDMEAKQRLHDTIKSLNRNQKRQLILFRGDGTGQGVRWELTRTTCA